MLVARLRAELRICFLADLMIGITKLFLTLPR